MATARYFNRNTLLIEHADPAYAAQVGLVLWEGEACPTEVDKTDVEYADVISDLDTLKKPELVMRSLLLGLSPEGTTSELRDAIDAHVGVALKNVDLLYRSDTESSATATELHGTPAAGDDDTNSPKEG